MMSQNRTPVRYMMLLPSLGLGGGEISAMATASSKFTGLSETLTASSSSAIFCSLSGEQVTVLRIDSVILLGRAPVQLEIRRTAATE